MAKEKSKASRHTGSAFDSFLESEGIFGEVAARAAKRTFVHELERMMKENDVKKTSFRKALKSPTTASRVFDDHTGISLFTLVAAAQVVGCEIALRLVPKKKVAG